MVVLKMSGVRLFSPRYIQPSDFVKLNIDFTQGKDQ